MLAVVIEGFYVLATVAAIAVVLLAEHAWSNSDRAARRRTHRHLRRQGLVK
jgi:hypothetical protein